MGSAITLLIIASNSTVPHEQSIPQKKKDLICMTVRDTKIIPSGESIHYTILGDKSGQTH